MEPGPAARRKQQFREHVLDWIYSNVHDTFIRELKRGKIVKEGGTLKSKLKTLALRMLPGGWDKEEVLTIVDEIFNSGQGDQKTKEISASFQIAYKYAKPAPIKTSSTTHAAKSATTATTTARAPGTWVAINSNNNGGLSLGSTNMDTGSSTLRRSPRLAARDPAPQAAGAPATAKAGPPPSFQASGSSGAVKKNEIKTRAWDFSGTSSTTTTSAVPRMAMEHKNAWDPPEDTARFSSAAIANVPSIEDQGVFIPTFRRLGDEAVSEVATAPLLSEEVLEVANIESGIVQVPQFSLFGIANIEGEEMRIFTNSNTPFSAFICGLQGSGKSHSLSCLLENVMIPEPTLGTLQKPLPGLVFHFSQHSQSSFRPCEAAFLGKERLGHSFKYATVRSIRILVSSSNYTNMKNAYSCVPNASVTALRFDPKKLTSATMLQLMALGADDRTPLYMHVLTQLLRDIATESDGAFDYWSFKARLSTMDFSREQAAFLKMRLGLLESFLGGNGEQAELFCTEPGVLTIVDLSCPFVDPDTACALFNIVLDFYVAAAGAGGNPKETGGGMVVALDEAHKYMTTSPSAIRFTESLLALVRQQRHYGARIIVSTQEPSVSPRLIDLCSVTICHRFTSPDWFEVLRQHVRIRTNEKERMHDRIVNLNVGEAVVFAANAAVRLDFSGCYGEIIKTAPGAKWQRSSSNSSYSRSGTATDDSPPSEDTPYDPLSDVGSYQPSVEESLNTTNAFLPPKIIIGTKRGYLTLQVRGRLTYDGGRSVMAVN